MLCTKIKPFNLKELYIIVSFPIAVYRNNIYSCMVEVFYYETSVIVGPRPIVSQKKIKTKTSNWKETIKMPVNLFFSIPEFAYQKI